MVRQRNEASLLSIKKAYNLLFWDYENTQIQQGMTAEVAIRHITDALKMINISGPLKFFVYVASTSVSRIHPNHDSFFRQRHESPDDEYPQFHYHAVYSSEEAIPGDGKVHQVADLYIKYSLQELAERTEKGLYQGRSLILISGDRGFRQHVESMRSYNMVVKFIKPVSVFASLTSYAMSVSIDTVFAGAPI
ncbi:hypothetical protein DY000_02058382 [Brassica cretica]|uniref:NYN domain-containing protein n=1 Tax=Brassica cretica TaxID=69181 RepID=A0ABQ7AFZ5_BRACR|nr:hypothetical protein DY000_02058382 [Brassica cretica]